MVLVVIGLLVGGILVGQDLIRAAGERAQITQIEKYNSAVNTFRDKYNALPGDMNGTTAAMFGFSPHGPGRGQGDGNGVIEGAWCGGAGTTRMVVLSGETALFWVDLSTAKLIDGGFNTGSCCNGYGGNITPQSTPSLNNFMPQAKIGAGNYVFVYSNLGPGYTNSGINYFALQNVQTANACGDLSATPTLTLSVRQAYDIDTKIDDGLPQSGRVTAQFVGLDGGSGSMWASGGTANGIYGDPPGSTTSPTATTCYDNGGTAAGTEQYSVTYNNGSGANCALSFQMQGAGR